MNWNDNRRTLYNHSCRSMHELADESVQMCVTSPPYWGLRKYAGEQESEWPDGWRGAYGLEPTVELYVAHSIEILREIRRVLRKDGVCFWNIGDSYSSWKDCKSIPDSLRSTDGTAIPKGESVTRNTKTLRDSGLKNKDLCLIPFRVALAAQADGWWVRSAIIWNKPNPMPESVTDRPTDSYEVAAKLGRKAVGYEISEEYCRLIVERNRQGVFV